MLVMLLNGCIKIKSYNGRTDIEHYKINLGDTKPVVLSKIGSPISKSYNNKQDTWYYIYTRAKHVSFLHPKYIYSKTLTVSFDSQEIVQDIKITENYYKSLQNAEIAIAPYKNFSLKNIFSSLKFAPSKNIK